MKALFSHIEIDGGILRGDRQCRWHFMVDVVDHDGTRACLWSGRNYDDAIRAANFIAHDFRVDDVRDVVGGGRE